MSFIQKNKKICIGTLVVLAVIVLIWNVSRNNQSGADAAVNESTVTESTMDSAQGRDTTEGAVDNNAVEETGSEGSDKSGTDENSEQEEQQGDRKEDPETKDETAILENQGELEIVVPEGMDTEGF